MMKGNGRMQIETLCWNHIPQIKQALIRNKIAVYQNLTRCKEAIHPVLITTYGVVANKYSHSVQRVITMNDLFM